MLSLVLALAVSQAPTASNSRVVRVDRLPGVRTPGGRKGTRGYAFFEFAPSGGAGMGAPCACTTPTGAKGEALTFTRASNGTCTKTTTGGLTTTGIANGDLVVCSSNQPRVEYDSQGVLGLLVESAGTNSVLRSQEVDNAAWTKEQDAAPRTPTVTADQAVAPDGTTTADRVQIPATGTTGQFSDWYQTWNTGALGDGLACSIYVKGVSASDTMDVCGFDGAVWGCTPCTYVTGSWTRCSYVDSAGSGTLARYCQFGANRPHNGDLARNALDIYVWGMDGKAPASYVTSYIPTVAAAVTRSAESATASVAMTITAGNYSQAVTVQSPAGSGTFVPFIAYTDASNYVALFQSGSTWNADLRQAGVGVVATNASSGMASPTRLVGYNDGTTELGLLNGVAFSTPAAGTKTVSVTTEALGLNVGGTGQVDGIVNRLCMEPIDPGGTRCR